MLGVHRAMDCGQNNFMLVWWCHQLLFEFLANKKKNKIKSVAYSSQGSHTGQLDFCN